MRIGEETAPRAPVVSGGDGADFLTLAKYLGHTFLSEVGGGEERGSHLKYLMF
jgi:hypothetical protein